MATVSQNIFITKKEKLSCSGCLKPIPKGDRFVAESEQSKGTCFQCSPFTAYTLLPPGNAAMTRRSKKYSDLCGVVLGWNQRRKRFERKGQFVEASAIEKARQECEADQHIRDEKNRKAGLIRVEKDKAYIINFAKAIQQYYPGCPENITSKIAAHACEKKSGRVGRTAQAKQFDKAMIDLAVEAHIRHTATNYDDQFGKGKRKRDIRQSVKFEVMKIMAKWRQPIHT